MLHDLLVGLALGPPTLHVGPLEPLVHQAQIVSGHTSEPKRHHKGMMAQGRNPGTMLETVLGATAAAWGVLMAISPALQIRKMLHHRSSREVSIAYFWVIEVGFALWVAYGITIENWFLVVPNAVAFTVCATTIVIALHFRRESG